MLSARLDWFELGQRKGWAVLIGVAVVGVGFLLLMLWFFVGLLFRRPLRYGLATLLLAVFTVAVVCSWLATHMEQARRQRRAFAVLRTYPGIMRYDYQMQFNAKTPPVPQWLVEKLGQDFFADVRHVCLGRRGGDRLSDDEFAAVAAMPRLEFLAVGGAAVTDRGLESASELRELQHLSLSGTEISDAGLVHLRGLPKLERLYLVRTGVTGAGLAHLATLVNLTHLYLNETAVTDAGLAHLSELTHLERLSLEGTAVTPAGVDGLHGALPKCEIRWDEPEG